MTRLRTKLNRLRTLLWREFIELRRDQFTLRIMVLIPVLQLALMAYAITTDFDHLPLCVLDRAHTQETRQFVSDIAATGYFSITPLTDADEVSSFFGQEHCRAALLIPADFSELMANQKEVRLGLLLDAADTTLATSTEGFLTAIARTFYTHTRLERTPLTERNLRPEAIGVVTPVRRVLFNPTLSGTAFTLPGLLGMICLFLTVFITAIALERERGTFEQLLATPLSLAEIMLGKIFPYVGVGFIALAMMMTGNYFCYGIAVKGSLVLLLAVALVFMLATMAFGIFLSSWAQNVQQAIFLGFFVMFPSVIVTGILVPTDNYPAFVSFLSHCLPARYFAHALRAITLKGAGLAEVSTDLLFLSGFFVLSLAAAVRMTKAKRNCSISPGDFFERKRGGRFLYRTGEKE